MYVLNFRCKEKMSSNHSSVHPDYDPNLKIKDEPDPALEPLASTAPATMPNLIQTIKTEPGLPTAAAPKPTIRLASLIPPRDLRLGGGVIKLEKPKKVYTPNLNAQRIKNREYVIIYYFLSFNPICL